MIARIGIKSKIVVAYTFVFGLLLVIFALITYRSVRNGALQELDAQLAIYAGKIAEDVSQDVEDEEPTETAEFPEFAPEGLQQARAQVWRRDGFLIITDSLLATLDADLPSTGELDESISESMTGGGRNWRVLWMPVEIDGEYPFVIQAAASLEQIESQLSQLRLLFISLLSLALFVCGLAAYGLTRLAFRPISSMSAAARQMSAERLDMRVAVPEPPDEVRELAETLNGLLSRIEAAFATQRQFVADASHELRTPLTVIRTELEYAVKQAEREASNRSIAIAISETHRLERLAHQLLSLVRLDSGQSQLQCDTVRLDDLLIDCVKQVKAASDGKRIEVDLSIEEALAIRADGVQLKSAFLNVIENAVKYAPPASRITIALSASKAPHGRVFITVTDDGPGIPEDEQDLIFRRFYRAKAQRGDSNGSGLGLAIAQNIVAMHGGRISLKSDAGHGACFTIELPAILV